MLNKSNFCMLFYKPELINEKIEYGIPKLLPSTVHIWPLLLEYSDGEISKFSHCLSLTEYERAQRFFFEKDYREFILARSSLRHILAYYTDLEPSSIEFITTETGKPKLAKKIEEKTLVNFNLSHSNGRALIAINRGNQVGIDLELIRYNNDLLGIPETFFFGSEEKCIANASPELKYETFFRFWVAKEAVLKGEGLGLGFPLDQFEVQFDDSQTAAKVTSYDDKLLSDNWTIHMLPCGGLWLGALAIQSPNIKIEFIS